MKRHRAARTTEISGQEDREAGFLVRSIFWICGSFSLRECLVANCLFRGWPFLDCG